MNIRLIVGQDKPVTLELTCETIFPRKTTIAWIHESILPDINFTIGIDELDYIAMDKDGAVWLNGDGIDKEPILKLIYHNGELINQSELNPALKPMGVC